MKQVTVRIPVGEFEILETEAIRKGRPIAAYIRELLQAHIQNKDFSDKIENEFTKLLESDRYDDVIVEKFLRAYDKKRKV